MIIDELIDSIVNKTMNISTGVDNLIGEGFAHELRKAVGSAGRGVIDKVAHSPFYHLMYPAAGVAAVTDNLDVSPRNHGHIAHTTAGATLGAVGGLLKHGIDKRRGKQSSLARKVIKGAALGGGIGAITGWADRASDDYSE